MPHQEKALRRLKSGAILFAGVGSGKSFTSLFFYIQNFSDRELLIITTAKKRDDKEWEEDLDILGVEGVVDSWNNIAKYKDVKNKFVIFDEQKAIGYGLWGRTFIKIARANKWLMLTATPADVWTDYIPVFCANNFYKHKTDFDNQHVEYNPFVSFPQVKKYHNEDKLRRNRDSILVNMPFKRHTTRHHIEVKTKYDEELYLETVKSRFNPFTQEPIKNVSEYTQVLRKITYISDHRQHKARWLIDIHDRIIVFYNYTYELEILKGICEELGKLYFQWNGKKHERLPDDGDWVYLVQYTAGAEGWNCVTTNVVLFYSLNYSYRITEQSEGRIDRLNTPFTDLYFYALTSDSSIDKGVEAALDKKGKFNAKAWVQRSGVIF